MSPTRPRVTPRHRVRHHIGPEEDQRAEMHYAFPVEGLLTPEDEVRPPMIPAGHRVRGRRDDGARRVLEEVQVPALPLRDQQLAVPVP